MAYHRHVSWHGDAEVRPRKEALTHALLETIRLVLDEPESDEDHYTSSPVCRPALRRTFGPSGGEAGGDAEDSREDDSSQEEPCESSQVVIPKRKNAPSRGGVPGGPCAHCGATESPQWRRPLTKKVILCNACGIYYSRHHTMPKRKKTPLPRRTSVPPVELRVESMDEEGVEEDGDDGEQSRRRDATSPASRPGVPGDLDEARCGGVSVYVDPELLKRAVAHLKQAAPPLPLCGLTLRDSEGPDGAAAAAVLRDERRTSKSASAAAAAAVVGGGARHVVTRGEDGEASGAPSGELAHVGGQGVPRDSNTSQSSGSASPSILGGNNPFAADSPCQLDSGFVKVCVPPPPAVINEQHHGYVVTSNHDTGRASYGGIGFVRSVQQPESESIYGTVLPVPRQHEFAELLYAHQDGARQPLKRPFDYDVVHALHHHDHHSVGDYEPPRPQKRAALCSASAASAASAALEVFRLRWGSSESSTAPDVPLQLRMALLKEVLQQQQPSSSLAGPGARCTAAWFSQGLAEEQDDLPGRREAFSLQAAALGVGGGGGRRAAGLLLDRDFVGHPAGHAVCVGVHPGQISPVHASSQSQLTSSQSRALGAASVPASPPGGGAMAAVTSHTHFDTTHSGGDSDSGPLRGSGRSSSSQGTTFIPVCASQGPPRLKRLMALMSHDFETRCRLPRLSLGGQPRLSVATTTTTMAGGGGGARVLG